MDFVDKDAYLWSVLPLSGVGGYPYQFTNVTTLPKKKSTKLYGISYPGIYNSNLRLITFTGSSDGPALPGIFLNLFSMEAVFTVKWKLPRKAKIGFYTVDYLPNTPNKPTALFYLLPTNKGVGLFEDSKGCFQCTNYPYFCVVVEGDLPVELVITYTMVDVEQISLNKLFTPITFAEWNCKPIMERMLLPTNEVITYPLPKYVNDSLARIQYLIEKALSITISEDPLNELSLQQTIIVTEDFPGKYGVTRLYEPGINDRKYFYDVEMQNIVPEERRTNYFGSIRYYGLLLKQFPGKNSKATVTFEVVTISRKEYEAADSFVKILIGNLVTVTLIPESVSVDFPISVQFEEKVTITNTTKVVMPLPINSSSFGVRFKWLDAWGYEPLFDTKSLLLDIYIQNISIEYLVAN